MSFSNNGKCHNVIKNQLCFVKFQLWSLLFPNDVYLLKYVHMAISGHKVSVIFYQSVKNILSLFKHVLSLRDTGRVFYIDCECKFLQLGLQRKIIWYLILKNLIWS